MYNDAKWNQKNLKKYDKPNSQTSSELLSICISSKNDRHPVPKTLSPISYTSLNLSTFHFFPFRLHPTTLHYTSLPSLTTLHLTPLHFSALLDDFRHTRCLSFHPVHQSVDVYQSDQVAF
jgi:hypothetical protein